jgi:hypothetical protein
VLLFALLYTFQLRIALRLVRRGRIFWPMPAYFIPHPVHFDEITLKSRLKALSYKTISCGGGYV